MQPSEFQDTAERLAQGVTEGDWRSAVSRAYYAVFHFFGEFFLSHGLNLGGGAQAHSSLYYGLNNCGLAPLVLVATKVDKLRRARIEADYDLTRAIPQVAAADSVQKAQEVVNDFQTLLTTLSSADIVDGARKYLQSIGRLPKP